MPPKILDYYLDKPHTFNGVYYAPVYKYIRNRNGKKPVAIFLHIQEGRNWGSWQHFRSVQASCTVMIAKNGDIWNTVQEEHGPWTNGDVKSPSARGVALLNTYGWDPNAYSLTIETEGFTGEWPKTQAQLDSVVWQIKQWSQKYGIPVDRIFKHADVNSQSRLFCPGDAFFAYVIQAVKGNAPAPAPSPAPSSKPVSNGLGNIPGFDGTKTVTIDGRTYYAQKMAVTPLSATNIRQWATTASDILQTTSSKVNVLGSVDGEKVDGVPVWWITEHGRMWAGATAESPKHGKVEVPTTPDAPKQHPTIVAGKNIYDGRVYYSAGADAGGRDVTASKDTTLYQYADLKGKKIREVKKGEKFHAELWALGDEVESEKAWWLVVNPLSTLKGTLSGTEQHADNPFTECYRIPCAHTVEKPF